MGQCTGREGARSRAPGWHRGAAQTPEQGVQGQAQRSQMWGEVKEGTGEGKLECLCELSQAAVSKEPSSWDSKEMT